MGMNGGRVGEGAEDGCGVDVEVAEVGSFSDEFLDFAGMAVLADEDGAPFDSSTSLSGFTTIFFEWGSPGSAPLIDAIVVIVRDEGGPEGGDFIVVESDVVDGDGTPGESAEDDLMGVDAVVGDDLRNDREGVVDGRLFVAPPGELVVLFVGADEGEVEPNGPASGESVAEGGVFDPTGGAEGGGVVAGEFYDEGVAFLAAFPVGVPMRREIERVVDLSALIGRWRNEDAFAGAGFFVGDGGKGESAVLEGLFWEIGLIAPEEIGGIVGHKVEGALDTLFFTGLQSADPEVGMEAANDALEEFLVGFPGSGEEPFLIGRDAADKSIRGEVGRERTWINVAAGHVARAPNLTGDVARFGGPVGRGEEALLVVEEDEGVFQGGVFVVIGLGAGELPDADARLGPMCERWIRCRIVGDEGEGDFFVLGGDEMIDDDAIAESAAKLDPGRSGREEFCFMADDRFVPLAVGGAGTAVGLEIPDLDLLTRKMRGMNGEDVLFPRDRQLGGRETGEGEKEKNSQTHDGQPRLCWEGSPALIEACVEKLPNVGSLKGATFKNLQG